MSRSKRRCACALSRAGTEGTVATAKEIAALRKEFAAEIAALKSKQCRARTALVYDVHLADTVGDFEPAIGVGL